MIGLPFGLLNSSAPLFGLTGVPQTLTSVEENNFTATANLYVDDDGRMRKRTEIRGAFTTVGFGSYNGGAPSFLNFGDDYHVRVTAIGASRYQSGDGLGTWLALTSDRSWQFSWQDFGPASDSTTYTVAFSDDGGSTTLDSFVMTFTADHDSP